MFFFTQLGAGCIMCSTELSRLCMDASLDDLVDNNAWRLLLRQRSCCLIYLQNHLPAWPIPAPSVLLHVSVQDLSYPSAQILPDAVACRRLCMC